MALGVGAVNRNSNGEGTLNMTVQHCKYTFLPHMFPREPE